MLSALLNLFLPPQCLRCHARVQEHGTLCLACWEGMEFITAPMCGGCGLPFAYGEAEMLCGNCIENRPDFSTARATFRFNDTSKDLIHKLKFQDETYLAPALAKWLARAGGELLGRCDVLVPVPMYPKRLKERRYNQAALLAQQLGKITDLPVVVDGLEKIKNTPPQTGLTRAQREKNLTRAFAVRQAHQSALHGKTVALIDDVMTTGSTAQACTKALLKAGASTIVVLTLARVANQ